jgi:hypothetical protein
MSQRTKRSSSPRRPSRKADPATEPLDDKELDGVAGGIGGAATGVRLEMQQSRTRQAQNTSFGAIVKEGMSKGADVALAGGQIAAPFIPGAAVVSAAITGVGRSSNDGDDTGSG